jgi:ubiquinone/menaquinone biosynthesis C-methylase UbiE|tara:strand:- start:10517 stop:11437 length:921 start_codon:yes stop_codon:yes gene_type:complete
MYKQIERSKKQWEQDDNCSWEQWRRDYYEDNYAASRLRAREKKVLHFLDDLPLKPEAKILELGFGGGITSAKIIERGYCLYGIDLSRKLCKLANKTCQSIDSGSKFYFIAGDAGKINFADNSFDCVIGLGFLHYLESPEKCLIEINRVLKPGGFFISTQRNMYGISSIDNIPELIKVILYLFTDRKYEFRYRDTFLLKIGWIICTILSPISTRMKDLKKRILIHKKVGYIKKHAFSYSRLKKILEEGNFQILSYAAAGFASEKYYNLFPRLVKKIDKILQNFNNKRKNQFKFGNGIVFLTQVKIIN